MAHSDSAYRRLPGRGLRRTGPIAFLGTSCRTFLGPDHLLCIDSSGYGEEYRRFYYADIQALVLRQTGRGRAWNIGLAVAALVLSLLALGLGGAGAVVFWVITGVVVCFLLINAARGPTCVAHLRTAVHVEEMPSLNRVRVARRALGALKAQIDQAQGVLLAETMTSGLAAAELPASAPVPGNSLRPVNLAASAPAVLSEYRGGLHWVLFSLLLADAGQSVLLLFIRNTWLVFLSSMLMGALGICTIVALIRQQGSTLSRLAKGVTWTTLVYLGIGFMLGYVVLIALSAKEPGIAGDQWRFLELMAAIDPFETPWYLILLVFSLVASTSLGLIGMLGLRQPAPSILSATPATQPTSAAASAQGTAQDGTAQSTSPTA